jgi:hypothetical protein
VKGRFNQLLHISRYGTPSTKAFRLRKMAPVLLAFAQSLSTDTILCECVCGDFAFEIRPFGGGVLIVNQIDAPE